MPQLLLINPSNEYKGLGNMRSTSWPPLALPYLAAVTPPHYTIDVLDENIQPFEYRKADIVGLTALTSSVRRAYEIARMYREKGIPTVIGGIHASMVPDEALQYCDTVVMGEAEEVWPRVLRDFEAGTLRRRYQGEWPDLVDLPQPRRDILQNRYYRWGSIQTSRGCPMNCTFCSVTAFNGRRFRRRPIEAVITELKQIPQKMVLITDDNLIGHGQKDRDWAKAFFKRIVEERIKKIFFAQATIFFGEDSELVNLAAKAGIRILFVGLESIRPETLQTYKKGAGFKQLDQHRYLDLIKRIRRAGILVLGAFVLGGDDDRLSVFKDTLAFIKKARIDILQVTKPTPLPGTQLWQQLDKEGRILMNDYPRDWELYRLTKLVFEPRRLSIEDVYEGFTYLRRDFYSPWVTLRRTVSTFLTTRDPVATLLAYKINASYRKAFRQSDHYRQYNRSGLTRKFEGSDA